MEKAHSADIAALLRYGVSAELIGLLEAIGTTTLGDQPRYPRSAANALNRMILCRNYGRSLWQLAHLLAAVAVRTSGRQRPGAVLDFFWRESAITPQRFSDAFSAPLEANGVKQTLSDALEISYAGGEFRLAPGYVPTLAALLEFVVHVQPALVEGLEQRLCAPDIDEVDALAREMQREVGEFLKQHMQPEHQQRKARRMLEWLVDRSISSAQLDDAVVLDYWQFAALEGVEDSKRFNGVAEDFVDLVLLLDLGYSAQAQDYALSLGADWEAGEVDLDRLESFFAEISEELRPLSRLQEPPLDAIKFLTDKDMRAMGPIEHAGPARRVLPLSLARMATLGAVQNQLSQGKRQKRVQLAALIDCSQAMTYADYGAQLTALRAKLDKTRACVLHILTQFNHPAAAVVAVGALAAGDQETLREQVPEAVSPDGPGGIDETALLEGRRLSALALQLPVLKERLTDWSKAFKGVNREGLIDLPERERAQTYAVGLDLLDQLGAIVDDYTTALEFGLTGSEGGVDFEADRAVFATVYSTLYGEGHERT